MHKAEKLICDSKKSWNDLFSDCNEHSKTIRRWLS